MPLVAPESKHRLSEAAIQSNPYPLHGRAFYIQKALSIKKEKKNFLPWVTLAGEIR
jgi:hypothetical protein